MEEQGGGPQGWSRAREGERGRKWDQRSQQGMAFRDLRAVWVGYDRGREVGGGGERGSFFLVETGRGLPCFV